MKNATLSPPPIQTDTTKKTNPLYLGVNETLNSPTCIINRSCKSFSYVLTSYPCAYAISKRCTSTATTARISPIARFLPVQFAVPTEKGMNAAVFVCHLLSVPAERSFSDDSDDGWESFENHLSG